MTKLLELASQDLDQMYAHIYEQINALDYVPNKELLSHSFKIRGKEIRPALLIVSTKMLCEHVQNSQGKHARSNTDFAKELYESIKDKVIALGSCLEIIHGACLIHDDVIDQSPKRRGQFTAHEVFSNKRAILGGDFALMLALENMIRSHNWQIMKTCNQAIKKVILGEIQQLELLNNCEISMEFYEESLSNKTASLFKASCKIAGLLVEEALSFVQSSVSPKVKELGNLELYGDYLGMAFQITDDALDYNLSRKGKKSLEDLLDRKATGVIIHAYNKSNQEDKDLLKKFFSQESVDQESGDVGQDCRLEKITAIIEKHDAINLCIEDAKVYAQKAKKQLEVFVHKSEYLDSLYQLVDHLVDRPS